MIKYTEQDPVGRISPSQVDAKLKEEHAKFLDYLNKRDFGGLGQIIEFFRRWLSYQSPPSSDIPIEIIDLIPHLLNLISDDSPESQPLHSEVTWLLANISAGTNKEIQVLVDFGAIPVLTSVFKSTFEDEIQENILWTLANISGINNLEYRDQMLAHGILDLIVEKFSKMPKEIDSFKTAVWLISNIVQTKPLLHFEQIKLLFPFFKDLLCFEDEEIEENVLKSLAALTEEAQEIHVKCISEIGLSLKIVKLMKAQRDSVSMNSLKAICNLIKAKGDLKLVKIFHVNHYLFRIKDINNTQLFGALSKTINSQKAEIRKQSCILLLNILSDDQFNDHSSLDYYKIMTKLIKIASKEQNEIGVQATLCLKKYLETASQDSVISAMEKGVLDVFFSNLNSNDVHLIENSLQVIHKLLEFGENQENGLNFILTKIEKYELKSSIENLESHQSGNIAHEAEIILSKFLF